MVATVALLRGINVGGKNKLVMAELREIAVSIGCKDPQTYIQSGNLVCGWPENSARLATALRTAVAAEAGFDVDVVIRDAVEFGAVMEENPFLARGEDPAQLHVAFADDSGVPSSSFVEQLTSEFLPDFLPDEAVVSGRHVYLYLPNGVGRSKLVAAVSRSTHPRYTLRNWRTVTNLAEMLRDL